MSPTSTATKASPRGALGSTFVASALIVIAIVLAYANTFEVPFLLDDVSAITENPSIRTLSNFAQVLSAPATATTGGRPLLNLSFAENWALGGEDVRGYHVVNLIIHLCSALLLFGAVRRVLVSGRCDPSLKTRAWCVALFAALIWALHPVNTESVTYISQRAESLMGCCYLATVYCFLRGAVSPRPRAWFRLAVAFCGLGVGVKEVMVTAPVVVAMLDRAFFSTSFRELLRRRRGLYLGLAASWLLLAALMVGARVNTWSEGAALGVSPWTYALNEAGVVLRYLKLAVWPHPLVFDYGTGIYESSVVRTLPSLIVLALLLVGTVRAWRRRPEWAFVAVAFFVLLAPTSSVVPIAVQPMAESRMYLPLAMFSTGLAALAFLLGGRLAVPVLTAGAVGLMALTFDRNARYESTLRIWSDSVAKFPDNDRARNNLALVLSDLAGRERDAAAEFEEALRLNPRNAEAHYNLANLLVKSGAGRERALQEYGAALKLWPDYKKAHNNLGLLLQTLPDGLPKAIAHFETAARLPPDGAEEHSNLAGALLAAGRRPEAVREYEIAATLAPGNATIWFNLGNAQLASGRDSDAIAAYRRSLSLRPAYAEAHNNLAAALMRVGRRAEAIAELEAAARVRPGDAGLHESIRRLKAAAGQ